ncbi:MAG TPA: hypothetical protein VH352_11760 [Pseudonocardiaceae bacterium]|nr:hypothetical protein [Pseudonocardiaceae bacterium]
MTNGFQADTAELARHAGEFPTFAARANAIHGELAAALDAAGPCWGDDPAGHSFAEGHVRPAESTLDSLGALSGRLADVGDRFTATARGYQQADEYSAGQLPD